MDTPIVNYNLPRTFLLSPALAALIQHQDPDTVGYTVVVLNRLVQYPRLATKLAELTYIIPALAALLVNNNRILLRCVSTVLHVLVKYPSISTQLIRQPHIITHLTALIETQDLSLIKNASAILADLRLICPDISRSMNHIKLTATFIAGLQSPDDEIAKNSVVCLQQLNKICELFFAIDLCLICRENACEVLAPCGHVMCKVCLDRLTKSQLRLAVLEGGARLGFIQESTPTDECPFCKQRMLSISKISSLPMQPPLSPLPIITRKDHEFETQLAYLTFDKNSDSELFKLAESIPQLIRLLKFSKPLSVTKALSILIILSKNSAHISTVAAQPGIILALIGLLDHSDDDIRKKATDAFIILTESFNITNRPTRCVARHPDCSQILTMFLLPCRHLVCANYPAELKICLICSRHVERKIKIFTN